MDETRGVPGGIDRGREAFARPLNTAQLGDLRIAYDSAGAGPPVVLLHGILGDHRSVRWQIDELSRDFSVYAWDAPGCGRSSDPDESWRMPEYADCLAEWITVTGIQRPHVVGVSWGGSLALELSRRHRAIPASLTLVDSYAGWAGSLSSEECAARLAMCLHESELAASAFIPRWIPALLTDAAPAKLRAEVASVMAEFHPVGYRAIAHALAEADLRDALGGIRVPTLLVWGEQDQRSPRAVGEALHRRIPGSELVVIPGVGHLSNAESPTRLNATVRRFVRSVVRSEG